MQKALMAVVAVAVGVFALQLLGVAGSQERPSVTRLMQEALATADGLDVVMDVVSAPAGSTLPKHYHPGEEFIYVLEGSSVLWQKGKDDIVLRAGDSAKIERGQIHTARTLDEPMKALVFRIHVQGQPERTLAE